MYQPRWGRFWLCAIFCGFLEAAIGCRGSSVLAVVAGAAAAVAIASFGAACTELDGNEEEFCRLSGALTAGEAGETIVESMALGLRGTAAITDSSLTGASAKTPATIRPVPTNSTRSVARVAIIPGLRHASGELLGHRSQLDPGR